MLQLVMIFPSRGTRIAWNRDVFYTSSHIIPGYCKTDFYRRDSVVIFLDIDGVICTTLSTRISNFLRLPLERQIFDPLSLYWLRRLVRRTGARVVLCSSWRDALTSDDPLCRAFIGNLYRQLEKNGTPVSDAAPQMDHGDKGEDILTWLEAHPCQRYAVLDDHDCFALGPSVRAHWVAVPENRGLRRREALAAEKLLTGG